MGRLSAENRERIKAWLREDLHRRRARATGTTLAEALAAAQAEEVEQAVGTALREGLARQRTRATGMTEADRREAARAEDPQVEIRTALHEGLTEQRARATGTTESDARYGEAKMPGKVKGQEAPHPDPRTARTDQQTALREGLIAQRGRVTGQSTETVRHSEENVRTNPREVAEAPVRLNAAWRDLTADGGLPLVDGVVYLWVIREDNHLILGIENPAKAAQAFQGDPSELPANASDAIEDLGHPTLAAQFGPDGSLHVGEGRIGGELRQMDGVWVINDSSGRYSAGREETKALLRNAAKLFHRCGVDEVGGIKTKEMDDWEPIDVS